VRRGELAASGGGSGVQFRIRPRNAVDWHAGRKVREAVSRAGLCSACGAVISRSPSQFNNPSGRYYCPACVASGRIGNKLPRRSAQQSSRRRSRCVHGCWQRRARVAAPPATTRTVASSMATATDQGVRSGYGWRSRPTTSTEPSPAIRGSIAAQSVSGPPSVRAERDGISQTALPCNGLSIF
jgi:hypothetical protein